MQNISKLTPAEKRDRIHTVLEAVQLFQISDFQGTFDSENIWIDETTLWQIYCICQKKQQQR